MLIFFRHEISSYCRLASLDAFVNNLTRRSGHHLYHNGHLKLVTDHVELVTDHVELVTDHVELVTDHKKLVTGYIKLAMIRNKFF